MGVRDLDYAERSHADRISANRDRMMSDTKRHHFLAMLGIGNRMVA
jgi:hypothetical protein